MGRCAADGVASFATDNQIEVGSLGAEWVIALLVNLFARLPPAVLISALTRINIEDLAHSAAALPTPEPDGADSILTEPDPVRQSRSRDRGAALMVIGDS
jgi:hypothetical protein